jgi:hypothetical protein
MRISRIIGNVIFFGTPPLFIALLCAALYFSIPVFGQFQPETVSRITLTRIMQLRDFRTFSAERIERTADRCDAEFGRTSPNPPYFYFSPAEKKIYARFEEQHRIERKKEREEGNYSVRRYPDFAVSYFESNLFLMTQSIYFRRMKQFDTANAEERHRILTESADDLKYWQQVYFDFVGAAGLPIPPLAELLQEYDNMIEGFKIGATEEEIRRIAAFKKNLNLVMLGKEMQKIDLKGLHPVLGIFSKEKKREGVDKKRN